MLKSISVSKGERAAEFGGDEKLSSLQRQLDMLDELKKAGIRVFRLSRMRKDEGLWGLLDSGATHPLRPPMPKEDLSNRGGGWNRANRSSWTSHAEASMKGDLEC